MTCKLRLLLVERVAALQCRYPVDAVGATLSPELPGLLTPLVDRMYEVGKAVNVASHYEIDDVIDPADTRRWILAILEAAPPPPARQGKKRANVDTW